MIPCLRFIAIKLSSVLLIKYGFHKIRSLILLFFHLNIFIALLTHSDIYLLYTDSNKIFDKSNNVFQFGLLFLTIICAICVTYKYIHIYYILILCLVRFVLTE